MDFAWLGNARVQTAAIVFALLVLMVVFQRLFVFAYRRFAQRRLADRGHAFAPLFTDGPFVFWLSFLPTPVYLYFGVDFLPDLDAGVKETIRRVIVAFLVFAGLRALAQFLRLADALYRKHPLAAARPIKGYLQTVSLAAHFFGAVAIAAILLDRSPWAMLGGLGALTAVLLLVFKDSILSLVAGIQVTVNDLLRVGDWIEMPEFGADGDVVDIALHAVKVQNWDKTITVIPAHKFLEHSFKNWRGMHESGGRRIKRAVCLDVRSIRFLADGEIAKFRHYTRLAPYLDGKTAEIADHNGRLDPDARGYAPNVRRLTNVGTFRHYLAAYLRDNPHIHPSLTFLVRQLAPSAEGLPIEVYVFANDTRWAVYEDIQADIFDHIFAILPEFGLRAFQRPSGHDFAAFAAPAAGAPAPADTGGPGGPGAPAD